MKIEVNIVSVLVLILENTRDSRTNSRYRSFLIKIRTIVKHTIGSIASIVDHISIDHLTTNNSALKSALNTRNASTIDDSRKSTEALLIEDIVSATIGKIITDPSLSTTEANKFISTSEIGYIDILDSQHRNQSIVGLRQVSCCLTIVSQVRRIGATIGSLILLDEFIKNFSLELIRGATNSSIASSIELVFDLTGSHEFTSLIVKEFRRSTSNC